MTIHGRANGVYRAECGHPRQFVMTQERGREWEIVCFSCSLVLDTYPKEVQGPPEPPWQDWTDE